MTAIKVEDLHKRFGKVEALRGLSLRVESGEVFGLLGPNGAGKTTTLRCLMDFIRPDLGSIYVFGSNVRRRGPEVRDRIGYLPSEGGLYDSWTGEDHIRFTGGKRSGWGLKLAKQLDLDPKRKVRNLSTGNKQKLRFLLALVADPELLVMDEPTTGLDPLLQNELYKLLDRFREGGGTIFLSSHNLTEVERICDRAGIVKHGKLIAIEPLGELRSKKVHHVSVYFGKKVAKKELELKGVEVTAELKDGYTLRAKGDIEPLIQKLSKLPVKDLEITHASLEEIFLEFYRGVR